MVLPLITKCPTLPTASELSYRVVETDTSEGIYFRGDYAPRAVRRWTLVFPAANQDVKAEVKSVWQAARGMGGAVRWVPPGESAEVIVRFMDPRLSITRLSATHWSISFRLEQRLNDDG